MKKCLLVLSLFPILILSCYTVNTELGSNSPKELYFKKAQELATYRDYCSAVNIYELYLQQQPQDLISAYTARYEIGYLKYKSGKYEEAKKDLTALLKVPEGIPNWIPTLSQKVIDKVNLKLNKKARTKSKVMQKK